MTPPNKINAVVDVKTGKVACVLLQAVYGGSSAVANLFDVKHWELAPSENFRMIAGTREEWQRYADKKNKI